MTERQQAVDRRAGAAGTGRGPQRQPHRAVASRRSPSTVGRTVLVESADDGGPGLHIQPGDAVVLCDHDAPDAPAVLRAALASEATYVAMMASRNRAAGLVEELVAEGVDASTLHVPAGHDLGGKAPGEIALSVVAEIVAESYGRSGGPMRG